MHITVEVTAGILRVFPEVMPYGTPFDLAVPFIGHEHLAILKAVREQNFGAGRETREALKAALRPLGFTAVRWRRYREGRLPHEIEFSISEKDT